MPALRAEGYEVFRLVRRDVRSADELKWNPDNGLPSSDLPPGATQKPVAVIHLAGVSIGGSRWTAAHAKAVYDSRVPVTRTLCERIAEWPIKPAVLLSASAVGYYGNRGEEFLTEESQRGQGVLSDIVHDWETACEPARKSGIRVVNLRTGIVLSPSGGALARMLLPFKLGVGGPLADGRFFFPWITLDDLVRIYSFALKNSGMIGAVNAVGPNPCSMNEFASELAKVLHRPSLFRVPKLVLKIVLGGELADSVTSSIRVVPKSLSEAGFRFEHPDLRPALASLLRS